MLNQDAFIEAAFGLKKFLIVVFNTNRVQEVFLVAIPLVLLPLVCSALSEVNFEGDRVVSANGYL